MSNPLVKWYGSKRGKDTVNLVLLVALVGSLLMQLGTTSGLGGWLSGTAAGLAGRYTCLPTCAEDDGRFLGLTEEFGGTEIVTWIAVEGGGSTFELGLFDGDSGRDSAGNLNVGEGHWDSTQSEVAYTLYADPAMDGSGDTVVGTWQGNADGMPNNAWHDLSIEHVEAAKTPEDTHVYRLVAAWVPGTGGEGISAFKLRSTGRLVAGRAGETDPGLGIVGMMGTRNDVSVLYPEFDGSDWSNLGPTTYDGEWTFYFEVPPDTETLRIWDGDFDRGTFANVAADTDDPNTEGLPPWADPTRTDPEGEGGSGDPPDDYNWNLVLRQPPVWYELIGPEGTDGGRAVFRNDEPSGDDEWEAFVVSTDPEVDADVVAPAIPPGVYELHIGGLDLYNIVWLHVDFELSAAPPGEVAPDEPDPTPAPLELRTCRGKPADILYVVDTSSTMGQLYQGANSKLAAAQTAILMLNEWVASLDNGSRVALVTFNGPEEGFGTPPIYPPDVTLHAPFTTDIRTVNTRLLGLIPSGTKPTAAALDTVADLLAGTVDPAHRPVMILISDGVPTVDFDRYRYDPLEVAKVSVTNADGTPLAPEVVRASGTLDALYGQPAGEPLADTMVAAQRLVDAMPGMPIYALSVQTGSAGAGAQILQVVATTGGGELYTASSAASLLEALQAVYAEQTCDLDTDEVVTVSPPEADPNTCAQYSLVSQEQGGRRRVTLKLSNSSDAAMVPARLAVTAWPESWGLLQSVKVLNGDATDVGTGAPVDLTLKGPDLQSGKQDDVTLQFESDVEGDLTRLTGYVEMTSGCRVTFGTAP